METASTRVIEDARFLVDRLMITALTTPHARDCYIRSYCIPRFELIFSLSATLVQQVFLQSRRSIVGHRRLYRSPTTSVPHGSSVLRDLRTGSSREMFLLLILRYR
jgi:hypothetical protein